MSSKTGELQGLPYDVKHDPAHHDSGLPLPEGCHQLTPTIGLYYPWIHFRDDDWVKVAMLYWDRLQRILRHGTQPATATQFVRPSIADGYGNRDAVASRASVAQVFATVIQEHAASLRREHAVDREDVGLIDHVRSRILLRATSTRKEVPSARTEARLPR